MIWVITGLISFGFMLAFDYCKCVSIRKGISRFNPWFIIGIIMLVCSWTALVINAEPDRNVRFWLGIIILAAGIVLYAYVLIIPTKKEEYTKDEDRSPVSRRGIYAKVRHPGFWCFLICSLGTGVAVPAVLMPVLLFAVFNLIYIWLQDRFFFPVYIEGYDEYKKETRFI